MANGGFEYRSHVTELLPERHRWDLVAQTTLYVPDSQVGARSARDLFVVFPVLKLLRDRPPY